MAKQLNVDMRFTADTSQAKGAIGELQKSLSQLYTKTSNNGLPLDKEIQTALSNIAKLKVALNEATNTSTGNLNLAKFNQQLNQSGLTLKSLAKDLINLGPAGERSFMELARSVVNAETPMRQTNALVGQLWITLKNVARFQLSSSIIHGFIGGIQGALGYAQDLNESLNNIRIVTGQTVDQMARFTEQANKTARQLSSTTLDYTNASLIYYQQGLNDNEVAERTEATLKLANVSRQSAEAVSDQMTAIWNNFADGSKSLEYYIDVITALGATTASSSQEIAGGMEKFASVAKTVGLSYEYAASALATIVAQTRQSEDTVGTGLRTIFARLDNLKLGETLEDGVTLTKYTEALKSIGVNVLDTNGNLKDMDTILTDIGEKWSILSDTQKTALAQTVGGVRQYANLMALFDNWDKFQQNLSTAQNSSGALQEQADIYAESWEAARNRVKAAKEAIFNDLINDNAFININKGIEETLILLDQFIDNIGGLPGVLSLLSTTIFTVFGPQISQGINNFIANLDVMSGKTESLAIQIKQQMQDALTTFNQGLEAGSSGQFEGEVLSQEIQRTIDLQREVGNLSQEQIKYRQELIAIEAQYGKNAVAAKEMAETTTNAVSDLNRTTRLSFNGDQEKIIAYRTMTDQIANEAKNIALISKESDRRQAIEDSVTNTYLKQGAAIGLNANQIYNLISAYVAESQASQQAEQAESNYTKRKLETDRILANSIQMHHSMGEIMVHSAQSISSIMFGINALKNGLSKLNDKNATPFEKITGSITAFAFGLPSLINGISKASKALDMFITSSTKVGMTLTTSVALAQKSQIAYAQIANAIRKNNIVQAEAIMTNQLGMTTETAHAAAIKLKNAAQEEGTALNVKETVTETANTTAVQTNVVARLAQVAVQKLVSAGLSEIIAKELVALGIIGLVVGAIALLVVGVKALVNAYNADAIAADKAAESAKKLAEMEKEANQEAQNLKNTIDTYDSAVKKLEECVKGTESWKEALEEVNSTALDVLNNAEQFLSKEDYEQLIKSFKNTGRLDEDILKKAQKQAKDIAQERQYAAATSSYTAELANVNAQQTSLSRSMASSLYTSEGAAVLPTEIKNIISELQGITELSEFKSKLYDLGYTINASDTTITNWMQQINNMGDTADKAAAKLALIAQIQLGEKLGEKGYSDSEIAYAVSQQKQYVKNRKEYWSDLLKSDSGDIVQLPNGQRTAGINKWSSSNNDVYQAALQALQEAGYNFETAVDNPVKGFDNKRELGFKQGHETQYYTVDQIADMIAGYEALQQGQIDADAFRSFKFGKNSQAQQSLDAFTVNFKSATNNFDFSAIATKMAKNTYDELYNALTNKEDINKLGEAFKNAFGLTYDEVAAYAKLMGVDVTSLINNMLNDFEIGQQTFEARIAKFSPKVRESFDNLKLNDLNLSIGDQLNIGDILQQSFKNGGYQGLTDMTSWLSSTLSSFKTPEALHDFIQYLGSGDWSSLTDLENKIQELGGVAPSAASGLAELIAKIKEILGLKGPVSVDEAATAYKKVIDITNGLSETNRNLDADKFNQLSEVLQDSGIKLEDYFIRMADGSYTLKGAYSDFAQTMQQVAQSPFLNSASIYSNRNAEIQEFTTRKNTGYDYVQNNLEDYAGQRSLLQKYLNDTGQTNILSNLPMLLSDEAWVKSIISQLTNGSTTELSDFLKSKDGFDFGTFLKSQVVDNTGITRPYDFAEFSSSGAATQDYELARDQLNFLSSQTDWVGDFDTYSNAIQSGDMTREKFNELADGVAQYEDAWNNLGEVQKANTDQILEHLSMVATSQENLYDLQQMLSDQVEQGIITAEEAKNIYAETIDAVIQAEAEDWEIPYEDVLKRAESIKELSDAERKLKGYNELTIEAAKEIALEYEKDIKAEKDLQENTEDYEKALDKVINKTDDWTAQDKNVQKLKKSLAQVLNLPFKNFTNEMAKAALNSRNYTKAIQGDIKAQRALTRELVKGSAAADVFQDIFGRAAGQVTESVKEGVEVGADELSTFQSLYDECAEYIENQDIETGPINLEPIRGSLNQLLQMCGGDVEKAKSMLASLSLSAEIEESEPVEMPSKSVAVNAVPAGTTIHSLGCVPHPHYNIGFVTVEQEAVSTMTPPPKKIQLKDGNGELLGKTDNGGNKGGGGGGGGGNKPKTPKAHKKSDISKRYHTVREQLEDTGRLKEEADRRSERAFGKEKIDQLEKENELRREEIKLQKEYIDQINSFLKGDRQDLVAAMGALNLKVNFDDQGVILNYQELEDSLLWYENRLIDLENALGGERTVEMDLQQRKIDDAREYLDRYEETLNLLEEQTTQLSEWIDELADSLFKVITTKVELNIGINDDEASRLEYFLTKYEDNAYKAAEAISVFGDQAVNQLKRIGIYQEGINELLASKGLTLADLENLDSSAVQKLIEEGDFTEEQVDSLREWRDGLLEANQAMMELRTNIAERVLDTFDQLNEKIENSYDLFDHYNSILGDYKDITDLLGRQINQEQRKLIDNLNNAMLENQKNTTVAAKARYEDLVEERAKAQALYDTALAEGGEDAAQKYEEILQNIDEALNDAEEQYLEAWKETMDTAQEIFETMLDNIVKDFENAMSGTFGSMDYLQEAFDRQGELDENYLDDYDKLYELNKLERELNKVLSDTRGVTNRKALLDLQAKINEYQENGVQLSQYDVDALRAKFELQQAYNDLMLARDAKSTVRLSRDNEGNWGYVYTANQDEVEEAEQTYEDKLHEYQKLNDEYIQTLQEKALEVQTTYRDTLREIMEDVTLTDEERDARVKELNDWLMAQQDFFAQQSQNVFDNQSETYDRMLKTYDVAVADLVDSWEETRLAMLTTIENMPDYMQNWQDASNEYLTSLTDALAQRMQVMNDILGIGETSVETFGDHIAGVIEKVGENSDKTVNQVTELAKILNQEFGQAIDGAIAWEEEYAQQMNAAIDANERMVKSVNDLIAALADIPSYNHLHDTLTDFLQLSKDYELGKISKAEFDEANKNLNLELEDFLGFDEGGYTGAWGSGGRLALLHEKENVFNQEDTANLLDAARLLRQIDMSAAYMATGFGNLSSPDIMGNGFVIQQEVHIEASFPDVTDSAEIEEAFNNLENKAAQYANRKNED